MEQGSFHSQLLRIIRTHCHNCQEIVLLNIFWKDFCFPSAKWVTVRYALTKADYQSHNKSEKFLFMQSAVIRQIVQKGIYRNLLHSLYLIFDSTNKVVLWQIMQHSGYSIWSDLSIFLSAYFSADLWKFNAAFWNTL